LKTVERLADGESQIAQREWQPSGLYLPVTPPNKDLTLIAEATSLLQKFG
jgi:hypothetical protein